MPKTYKIKLTKAARDRAVKTHRERPGMPIASHCPIYQAITAHFHASEGECSSSTMYLSGRKFSLDFNARAITAMASQRWETIQVPMTFEITEFSKAK